jgi:PIN domain nuclease of toxin-antitoxin system
MSFAHESDQLGVPKDPLDAVLIFSTNTEINAISCDRRHANTRIKTKGQA